MSAAFSLALDTTAPTLSAPPPTVTEAAMRVSFSLSEPSIEQAVAVPVDGDPITGSIEPDGRLVFVLSEPWQGGVINIDLIDDVWNRRRHVIDLRPVFVPVVEHRSIYMGPGWSKDDGVRAPFTGAPPFEQPMIRQGQGGMRSKS